MSDSYFKRDSSLEKELNKILMAALGEREDVEFLYPRRNDDYDFKKDNSGIDAIVSSEKIFGDSTPKNVDFKSATSWVANSNQAGLRTFAFELSFLNRSREFCDGWLFGDKYSETEYYSLQWLWKRDDFLRGRIESISDIGKAESLLVAKKDVQEYARNLNITPNNYRHISQWLFDFPSGVNIDYYDTGRRVAISEKKSEYFLIPDKKNPRITCSKYLAEAPVNLLIPKEDLIEMTVSAEGHQIIPL